VLYYYSGHKIHTYNLKIALLFISVYIIHIVGLIHSNNIHQAFFELEKKFSLLLFPISFLLTPKLNQREIKIILMSFVISCLLTVIYCFLIASYSFIIYGDYSIFYYHKFSGIVGMHANYLSIYLIFSIAILVFINSKNILLTNHLEKIFFYIALIILTSAIILLSGRTQISLLFVGSSILMIYKLTKNNKFSSSIIKIVVLLSSLLIVIFFSPFIKERFKSAINYNNEYSLDKKWGEGQMRYLMWSSALELIKREPFMGVGTGDVQDELQKKYIENNFYSLTFFKETRFNAHNQFLETTIGLGILGIILFILSIIFPLILSFKQKNILYGFFLIHFAISCLTESLLERQNGIVFFALFNSFFFFSTIYIPESQKK
jgi:O-antigen ligase